MKNLSNPELIHRTGTNGEGKTKAQLANPGSPGKWPVRVCVCACVVPVVIANTKRRSIKRRLKTMKILQHQISICQLGLLCELSVFQS